MSSPPWFRDLRPQPMQEDEAALLRALSRARTDQPSGYVTLSREELLEWVERMELIARYWAGGSDGYSYAWEQIQRARNWLA